MKKAPPFDWEQFHRALAADPHFDVFAQFSFHQVSRADKAVISQRVAEARLAANPKEEKHHD